MDNLLEHLKEIGFNVYESKVYLSLLKKHPATGYEVSKESGVPQARAYDTLKVLENKKIVVQSGDKPAKYIPVNPDEILKKYENNFQNSIDYLKTNLPDLSDDYVEPVFNIKGDEAILKTVLDLINNAQEEIFIEVWSEEFNQIKEALRQADKRGVNVKVVGYNDIDADFGIIYQHALGKSFEEEFKGRLLVMAVDDHKGLIGTISATNTSHAVTTQNPALILVIKEMVIHDMYMLDIEDNLKPELNSVYGENLLKLRNKILGKDVKFITH